MHDHKTATGIAAALVARHAPAPAGRRAARRGPVRDGLA